MTGTEIPFVQNKTISFCEKVFELETLQEFLLFIQESMPKKLMIGEIILFYKSSLFGFRRAYVRNHQAYDEIARDIPLMSGDIRLSTPKENVFLAQEMGRPFVRVLKVPLLRSSKKRVCFFIELREPSKQLEIQKFFRDRREIIEIAFEKIFLNTTVYQASSLWERIFGKLGEPLSILKDNQVIVSNQVFQNLIKEHPDLLSMTSVNSLIKACGKIYKPQVYPFHPLGDGSLSPYSIFYGQDLTKYFLLREELLQSEKMIAIEKLGHNMAHQLNNPLTGMRSIIQYLKSSEELKDLKEDLIELEEAVERPQRIIFCLLKFSEREDLEKERLDIKKICNETLILLKSVTQGVSIMIDLEKNLCINGVSFYFQQALFNLIKNSCQALNSYPRQKDPCIRIQGRRENNQVWIQITDNGPGIPQEYLDKVFEPLFTTKAPGEGTGLGLGLTKRFVNKLDGTLSLSSSPGKGVVFDLNFSTPQDEGV